MEPHFHIKMTEEEKWNKIYLILKNRELLKHETVTPEALEKWVQHYLHQFVNLIQINLLECSDNVC